MAKIMVAMSGGVDSSLAAALLHEQGHEVIGVTMHLWEGDDERLAESLCCSQEMTESARRVCAQLGISYYVFNYQAEFRRHVIDYFVRAYAGGYTPNPCLECNREIKFRALLKRAAQLGYTQIATGHYAQIATNSGQYELHRALDHNKDQSYMLYMLQQADLARIQFPLGGYSKTEVRTMAAARGLASADREESQDICFVPGGDYRNLLREEAPASLIPGPIVNQAGQELGQHNGLPLYTIGQRRGLGLGGGALQYVIGMDPARNALIVGPDAALHCESLRVERTQFVAGNWPNEPFSCLVQLRAHAEAVPADLTPLDADQVEVRLHTPVRAIAPGQAAVFYAANRVLGGGLVARQ